MFTIARRRWRPFFVVGCVTAVVASAIPLVQRTHQNDLFDAPTAANALVPADQIDSSDILVDLRDNATPTDISDLNMRFGLQLRPNSIEASANKLMRASVPTGTNTTWLLSNLRQDPRVEAAERDSQFAAPEDSTSNALGTHDALNTLTSSALPTQSPRPLR